MSNKGFTKIALIMTMAAMMAFSVTACGNKQAVAPAEGDEASNEVAFEVAKNYFFKNDQEIPASPKITTAEEFGKLFGMATTMGKDGKPTEIDFTKQFVLAIVLSVTNLATEITPCQGWRGSDIQHTTHFTHHSRQEVCRQDSCDG